LVSEATRLKMSESAKRRWARARAAGPIRISETHRKNISEGQRRRWEERKRVGDEALAK